MELEKLNERLAAYVNEVAYQKIPMLDATARAIVYLALLRKGYNFTDREIEAVVLAAKTCRLEVLDVARAGN